MSGAGGRPRGRLQAPGPRLRTVAPPGTTACRGCGHRLLDERYARLLLVCPECGHHERLSAAARARSLADPGTLEVLALPVDQRDPLGFDDGTPYRQRLATAREATGADEAMLVCRAAIGRVGTVLACMEFAFMGGSLGGATGDLFVAAAGIAVRERRALVAVCSSGGARMQEGVAALAQMARCSTASASMARAGLPYITILADPCFGGVTASFATQADVVLAEPGARIGFAGGRVIAQSGHEALPEGFQTSEFLLARGMLDAVVHRSLLRDTVGRLLHAYGQNCAVSAATS